MYHLVVMQYIMCQQVVETGQGVVESLRGGGKAGLGVYPLVEPQVRGEGGGRFYFDFSRLRCRR